MRELGLEGARRGRRHRTAIADPGAPRAADLVQLRLTPARPDAVWVADFTRVATWAGTVYVAFVLDAHSRRILGWRAATSMRTDLLLDALEQALWTCTRQGVTDLSGSCATTTPDRNTRRLRSPSASPPPAPRPASERSATPWITPWPRVRSGCSRPELIRRRLRSSRTVLRAPLQLERVPSSSRLSCTIRRSSGSRLSRGRRGRRARQARLRARAWASSPS
jgi:hypothetical protein